MNIYNYDADGFFVGESEADESPLEPGVYLVPSLATATVPPTIGEGLRAKFNGETWDTLPIPVQPARSLSDVWTSIKSERDRRRFDGGVKVGAHWFQTTAVATSEYNSLALIAAGLPGGTVLRAGWRTMDGGLVEMTPDLVRQILVAGFATVAAIDDAAEAHKAALAVSSDPAAYDFSAGWPAIYEA